MHGDAPPFFFFSPEFFSVSSYLALFCCLLVADRAVGCFFMRFEPLAPRTACCEAVVVVVGSGTDLARDR